jgi:MGT family glycosyltransferase
VGPQLERSEPFEDPGSVVVSFSSRHAAAKIVQRVLDALGKCPVTGLVTLGPALAPVDLRLPRNVVARPFVPHGAVLPNARLVITHAGLGTVMAALANGVPLLCIPLKNDQFENAARVVAVGAGLRLGAHARRSSIERAVQRILDDRRYRDRAARMAEAVAAYDGLAVAELEALGATRHANRLSSPAATFLKPSL